MDDTATSTQVLFQDNPVTVTYRGTAARRDAESFRTKLQASGLAVGRLIETGAEQARLGTPEVVLTILATAAVKAVAATVLGQFDDYLRQRMTEDKKDLNVQVVVKDPASPRRQRFLLSLKVATEQSALAFSANVRKAIDSL